MKVALVNTNRMRPPIGPLGLEYVAEALFHAGHRVEVLDLAWAADPLVAIDEFFADRDVGLVGVTLRNSDDCAFTTRESFLEPFADMVGRIRRRTGAVVALGGVGFSVMPETVLEMTGAHVGVWGEGEFSLPRLADRLARGKSYEDVPNLVLRENGGWRRTRIEFGDLSRLPPMHREWFDNPRYFEEGGQAGVETKRGCSNACTYCADPVAKGHRSRVRPPVSVVDEIESLLAQGIDHFHTCDAEFNIPEPHARAVCEEVVRRNLGDRIVWYAYCSPTPFTRETAIAMRDAGCAGINFGADHGDDEMLERLCRAHSSEDILNVTEWCREAGIAVMLDLLIGSPGETEESVRRTIEVMKRSQADQVGVALGIRVWPGTPLARAVLDADRPSGLLGGRDPSRPLFYLAPEIAKTAPDLIDDLVQGDPRFLFFNPSKASLNYNYNDNQILVDAIADGHRGAFWDILRRLPGDSTP